MLDARKNLALRSYMNFNKYRKTIELLEKDTTVSQDTGKKGIMSAMKNANRQRPMQQNQGSAKDKELKKVLEYVKMIEGFNNVS